MKITSLKKHGTISAYRKGCRCQECDTISEVYELAGRYNSFRYMVLDDDWESRAQCKGEDTNIFLDPSYEQEAKKFCNRCSVRDQCLGYALRQPGTIGGIYGGFSDLNRNRAYRLHLKLKSRERASAQQSVS